MEELACVLTPRKRESRRMQGAWIYAGTYDREARESRILNDMVLTVS